MCETEQELELDQQGSRALSRRTAIGGVVGGVLASSGLLSAATASAAAPVHAPSRAPLELVLLGTQGGPPVDRFHTGIASALVVDGATYVIDCGRAALTQYYRAGLTLASLRAIFLTHLHADHVADYFNFILLGASTYNSQHDIVTGPLHVYGPGRAGGLPPKFGGGTAPTIRPSLPTPGTTDMTDSLYDAFAYSTNLFMRDSGIRDPRTVAHTHDIPLPSIGADHRNTAPAMRPFTVMEDDRVKVTAILVPHGPAFPSFAYRFDTDHGSVTFSGDTTYTGNIPVIARGSDALVHEAVNLQGFAGSPALAEHIRLSHVDVQKVGPIAEHSDVRHLVLSHIGDFAHDPLNRTQWKRWAQHGYHGRVTVGDDLMRIPVSRRGVPRVR